MIEGPGTTKKIIANITNRQPKLKVRNFFITASCIK